VRARAQRNGWLAANKIQEATGIDAATMTGWRQKNLLTGERLGPNGESHYPAADVVRTLGLPERP
jgi:hypothetical protein